MDQHLLNCRPGRTILFVRPWKDRLRMNCPQIFRSLENIIGHNDLNNDITTISQKVNDFQKEHKKLLGSMKMEATE